MVTERIAESRVQEIPYSDINADTIREFLPGWRGNTDKDLGTNFQFDIDGHLVLRLSFITKQADIWLKDETYGQRFVLDQDYYYLGDVDTVILYRDEGKATFFTNDRRGKLEISNKGRRIVFQRHEKRTNKTVEVDLS